MSLAWQVSMNILHKWETLKHVDATASVVIYPSVSFACVCPTVLCSVSHPSGLLPDGQPECNSLSSMPGLFPPSSSKSVGLSEWKRFVGGLQHVGQDIIEADGICNGVSPVVGQLH